MDMIKEVIYHLRTFERIYISEKLERYLTFELEEDLFPHGFGAGDIESIYYSVKYAIRSINCGDLNLSGSAEDRLLERYELLKEEYLDLLAEMNRSVVRDNDENYCDEIF